MNMAICYYMDDMIRHRNEIGDWSDNLTICCIEPGYHESKKYQLEEYLDNDPPLLAVHLQTWKEPPQDDRPQDRECYYSLVIQRGASGVQLLVYLMTGNKQGPCQRDNKYMHMRWVRCLDLVRVILQKAWELPAACSFGPFAEYRNPKKDLDAKDWGKRMLGNSGGHGSIIPACTTPLPGWLTSGYTLPHSTHRTDVHMDIHWTWISHIRTCGIRPDPGRGSTWSRTTTAKTTQRKGSTDDGHSPSIYFNLKTKSGANTRKCVPYDAHYI